MVRKSFSLIPVGNVQLAQSHVLMFGSLFFLVSFVFYVTVVMVGSIYVGMYFGLCHSVGLVWLFLVVEHFYRVFSGGTYF